MNNRDQPEQRVMTIKQVSEYLKIPASTIYELAKKGKIRGVKLGKHWRFLEEDILSYLDLELIRTAQAAPGGTKELDEQHQPSPMILLGGKSSPLIVHLTDQIAPQISQ